MRSRTQLIGALTAALLTGLPLAAQTRSVKSHLPESTVLMISMPDIAASLEQMRQMPLFKMWAEDEVQDFLADVLQMADTAVQGQVQQARDMHEAGLLPIDPDQLAQLRVEGATVAVTSLELSPGQFSPVANIGILVHLEFGDSAPVWNQLIGMGLEMLQQSAPGMFAVERAEIGDFAVTTLTPQGPEDQPMSLNVAMLGSGVVIGTVKEEVADTLRSLNAGETVLTASEDYRAVFERIDGDGAEIEVFGRIQPFIEFGMQAMRIAAEMEPDFPEELDVDGIGRVLDTLGLGSIQAFGAASRYDGDKSVTSSYTLMPENQRRGLFAGGVADLDLGFLPWVPRDAVSFSAMACDVGGFYDSLVKAVQAYDPEMAEMALGQVAQMEEQLGMSIRNDLFGSLGDQVITWSMPMPAAIGAAPEMAILMKVTDQEKLLKSLRIVSQLVDGAFEIDEVERRGISAYQISLNWDPTGGMGMNPLSMYVPTFSFKDGYLVMGFSAADVKRVFDRMDREPDADGDIRSNEQFAPYLGSLPRQGLRSLSFTDWKANFESIYQALTGVLAFVPVTDDIPLDFALLPDSSTLTQHLSGGISFGVTDENGSKSTSLAPFGPEIFALAAGIGAGAAFLYQTMR